MASRRSFFLLPLAIAWGRAARAALPPADREIVARIEAWLQGVTTLRARFTQLAPDGRMSTGRVFIHRPGRLRFDYDPPSRVQLIATDWRLIFVDWAARQVNVLPLSQTPLAFLLDEKVQLSGELEVRRVQRRAGEVALEVAAPVTQRTILDALEARYPMLRGTIRDQATQRRRPFLRFFACRQDLSHQPPDDPLPDAVTTGAEPLVILAAIAGG